MDAIEHNPDVELLRDYWDCLTLGKHNCATELDPDSIAIVQRLRELAAVPSADEAFVRRLRDELRQFALANPIRPQQSTISPNGQARSVSDRRAHPASPNVRTHLRTQAMRFALAAAVIAVILGGLQLRSGQGWPIVGNPLRGHQPAYSDSVPAPVINPPLMQVTLESLPPTGQATVSILRWTFDPGSVLTINAVDGSDIYYVEQGSVLVAVTGGILPVQVIAGTPNGAIGPPENVAHPDGFTIGAGEGIVFPIGTRATLHNAGADRASLIETLSGPTVTSIDPTTATWTSLAGGDTVALPPAPIVLTLERVTLGPSERLGAAPNLVIRRVGDDAAGTFLEGFADGSVVNRSRTTSVVIDVITIQPASGVTP